MDSFNKWVKKRTNEEFNSDVSGPGATSFNKDMTRLHGHMSNSGGTDMHRQAKLQRLGAFLSSLGYGKDSDKLFSDIRMIMNNPEKYGFSSGGEDQADDFGASGDVNGNTMPPETGFGR